MLAMTRRAGVGGRRRTLASIAFVLFSSQLAFAQNSDADIRQRLTNPASLASEDIASVLAA